MEQTRYQIRFDWAIEGAHAIGSDADVLIWVDAIAEPGSELVISEVPSAPAVVLADLPSAHAVAQWAIDFQVSLGRRIIIAIIAAGSTRQGHLRVATEDLLAAGAIIDQLAALGLDATSPEAAAAEASYRGLVRATSHLFTAVTTATATPPTTSQLKVNPEIGVENVRVLRK